MKRPRRDFKHMSQPIRILIVENNINDAELIMRELYRAGFDPHWLRVDTETDYLANLSPDLDLILSNHGLPQFSGSRALELLKQSGLETPIIIVSELDIVEIAVKMMREGAADYVLKEQMACLGSAVRRALAKFRKPTSAGILARC